MGWRLHAVVCRGVWRGMVGGGIEFQTDQCGHRERLDLGIAAEVPADSERSEEGGMISAADHCIGHIFGGLM